MIDETSASIGARGRRQMVTGSIAGMPRCISERLARPVPSFQAPMQMTGNDDDQKRIVAPSANPTRIGISMPPSPELACNGVLSQREIVPLPRGPRGRGECREPRARASTEILKDCPGSKSWLAGRSANTSLPSLLPLRVQHPYSQKIRSSPPSLWMTILAG